MKNSLIPWIKKIRPIAAPLLVIVTLVFFVYYFAAHPEVRTALAHTSRWTLILIVLLYIGFILSLAWVYHLTLCLCGKRLPPRENLLLTCYSTIANFFGPLQSGPGVRATYLKQKHRVKLRDYTFASLIYYALYAMVSALFILAGSGRHWPVALGILAIAIIGSLGVLTVARRLLMRGKTGLTISPKLLALLLIATILQLGVQAVIYFMELQAVHTGANFLQALTYGGAANFALFVSLTPGAIGFREAFLAFSQQLHHISTAGILAASVIDRAVFVAFLGILFLFCLAMHANDKIARYASQAQDSPAK